MTAARDRGAVRQSRDQYIPAGSTQSASPHIRFATASVLMWADLGCPFREHAEQTPHHKIDRGHGRDNVEPGPIRTLRRAVGQSIPRSDASWPPATEAGADHAAG